MIVLLLIEFKEQAAYVSVSTGNAPDANALPIEKENADAAFMPLHVLVVELVWQPVRMPAPVCLFQLRLLI